MNPLLYFQDLFTNGTMGSYFSMSVWGVLLISILSGLIFGFKRGFSKTVVRTLTVLLAAVCAFIVAINADAWICSYFYGMTVEEVAAKVYPDYATTLSEDIRNFIACFDTETTGYIARLIVAVVLVPTVFSVAFSLLHVLFIVIYWILVGMMGLTRRKKGFTSTLLGSLMGIVQGALIALIVLLPVAGFTTLATEFKEPATREDLPDATEAQVTEFYAWWLDDLIENPLLTAISKCGGNMLFEQLTVTEIDDESYDSGEQLKNVAAMYVDGIVLYDLDWKHPDAEEREAMSNIVSDVGGNEYNAAIVSGLLRGISRAVNTEVLAIEAEEPFSTLINSIIDIFATSNNLNLKGDLDTLLHVYYILAENGVLDALDDKDALKDCMLSKHEDGKTVIDYVTDELILNARTAPVVTALTKISVAVMCQSMGMEEDASELYDNVKTGVNEILAINESDYESRDEYVDAVATELDTTLKENNIELDEEIIDNMADYIAENYSDVSEITDDDINKAILSYYNAYATANQGDGTELPPIGDLLP